MLNDDVWNYLLWEFLKTTTLHRLLAEDKQALRRVLKRRRNCISQQLGRTTSLFAIPRAHSLRIWTSAKAGSRQIQAKIRPGPDGPKGPSGLSELNDAALARLPTPTTCPFTCVHTLQGPVFAVLKQVVSAEHTAVQRRVRGKRRIRTTLGWKASALSYSRGFAGWKTSSCKLPASCLSNVEQTWKVAQPSASVANVGQPEQLV